MADVTSGCQRGTSAYALTIFHLLVTVMISLVGGAEGARLATGAQDASVDTLILISEGRPDTLGLVRRGNEGRVEPIQASFQDLSAVVVRLSDDSPEDGHGGTAWFPAESDIRITYRDGTVDDREAIHFAPVVEGGFIGEGFLAADGLEAITLTYDFSSPSFSDRASLPVAEIEGIRLRLVLGNDYRVELFFVYGDSGATELVAETRATGNVVDISNLVVIDIAVAREDTESAVESTSWAQVKGR